MKRRIIALFAAVLMIFSCCGYACAEEICLHENASRSLKFPGTLFTDAYYTEVCPDCAAEITVKKARTSLPERLFDAVARLFFVSDKPVLSENFTVTAHTGPGELPMNGMFSLRYSLQSGADVVEFDLNINSDGVAVMAHGEPDEARATLEEGFALVAKYADIKVNVDVKNKNAVSQAQALAIKYGILDRIFYTGLNERDIEYVKENSPLVPYYLNVGLTSDPEKCIEACDKAVSLGAIGLNFSYNDYSPAVASAARERGLLLSVYTVNSLKDMRRCLTYDIDNITTEFPYKLYTVTGGFRDNITK